jgi:DNA-binding NarL/FixJ family response regulator
MTNETIIIADDHPLLRSAMREAVKSIMSGTNIQEAGTFEEMVDRLNQNPNTLLILLDLKMPGVQGLSGLIYLRSQHPDVPVLVVSGNDDVMTIRKCMEFGACGFMPKTLTKEQMGEVLNTVLEGGTWVDPSVDVNKPLHPKQKEIVSRILSLTPQQQRVLMMLREGMLNKQIAYDLKVSEATVKAHVSAILLKLGVESRTQAVIMASQIDDLSAKEGQMNEAVLADH